MWKLYHFISFPVMLFYFEKPSFVDAAVIMYAVQKCIAFTLEIFFLCLWQKKVLFYQENWGKKILGLQKSECMMGYDVLSAGVVTADWTC